MKFKVKANFFLLNIFCSEQATAEASIQILFTDSLNFYIGSMHKSINEVETYLKLNELITLHHKTKTEAMAQVWIFNAF